MTVTTKRISCALGLSRKSVLERSQREGWFCVKSSGGIQFVENKLPIDVRLALAGGKQNKAQKESDAEKALSGQGFKEATEKARDVAAWRKLLIADFNKKKAADVSAESFIETYNEGGLYPILYAKLGRVALTTFYRWLKAEKEQGVSGLIPRYGQSRGGAGESLSEMEKAYLEMFYLQPSQPSIPHALFLLKANVPDTKCNYQTARRYLNSLPKPLVDFKRLGVTQFNNKHQPFVEQNIYQYKSLDRVVSDHHCLDLVIKYRGKLIRPWVTTFQDYRSGKILGWCPSVSPSSLSILAAYYMTVINYGVPVSCLFDNGKDYRSKLINGHDNKVSVYTPEGLTEERCVHIQGVLAVCGSDIIFTEVYNGKSKGRQENYFKKLGEYLAKDSGSYIGHDTTSRPEEVQTYYRAINGKAQRTDFNDWDWFVNACGAVIRMFNDYMPSGGKGMNGKTPAQVFEENRPDSVRHHDTEFLRLALSKGAVRKVRANRVELGERKFYAQELFTHSGTDVIVRQLLTSDEEVTVCDTSGAVICSAYANVCYEGEDLQGALKRVRGMRKRNLATLAQLGTKEAVPAPEYQTAIEVAQNMYRQNDFLEFEGTLELPKAAGCENVFNKPENKDSGEEKPKLKSPYEAKSEDYL